MLTVELEEEMYLTKAQSSLLGLVFFLFLTAKCCPTCERLIVRSSFVDPLTLDSMRLKYNTGQEKKCPAAT